MTDLEITRLCAEAMGHKIRDDLSYILHWDETFHAWYQYNPLHDDAQAMALVKRFGLILDPQHDGQDFANDPGWEVSHPSLGDEIFISPDLNRAIFECVAKMQAAK